MTEVIRHNKLHKIPNSNTFNKKNTGLSARNSLNDLTSKGREDLEKTT